MRAGRKGGKKTDHRAFVHSMHHERAVGPACELWVLDGRPSVGRGELGDGRFSHLPRFKLNLFSGVCPNEVQKNPFPEPCVKKRLCLGDYIITSWELLSGLSLGGSCLGRAGEPRRVSVSPAAPADKARLSNEVLGNRKRGTGETHGDAPEVLEKAATQSLCCFFSEVRKTEDNSFICLPNSASLHFSFLRACVKRDGESER